MNSDFNQQLVMLCHQLHSKGLQPSVAMVRSKAPMKVSVSQAIEAIKQFNASAKAPQAPSVNQSTPTLEKRIEQLEAAVALLEQRLNKLSQPDEGAKMR